MGWFLGFLFLGPIVVGIWFGLFMLIRHGWMNRDDF